ncbi:MAG TPA: lipopolysaccharide assembly protein LapA domain-containing protein [Xanthomonadaceae bacterium]|nr:lipopolysaccharide assembly protein LapA domain-containing protein [Xanthomonadaceae bacterium]
MRLIVIPLAILFALAGILFGSLNASWVEVDLYAIQFSAPLGVLLLGVLAVGALAGGLCLWLTVVLPMGGRLRRAERVHGSTD